MVIQEDQAGELGLPQRHLKYDKMEGFKVPPKPEPYYHYPRIESSYLTCDTCAD